MEINLKKKSLAKCPILNEWRYNQTRALKSVLRKTCTASPVKIDTNEIPKNMDLRAESCFKVF